MGMLGLPAVDRPPAASLNERGTSQLETVVFDNNVIGSKIVSFRLKFEVCPNLPTVTSGSAGRTTPSVRHCL